MIQNDNLENYLNRIIGASPQKLVISKPFSKSAPCRRIDIEYKSKRYHVAKYDGAQVFHENLSASQLQARLGDDFMQKFSRLNAWADGREFALQISKKRKLFFSEKKSDKAKALPSMAHNRRKNYLLAEGDVIEPLVDMGIFTREGKVIQSMYGKYKQINRFIEMIDDVVRKRPEKHLNIVDFGCGKSYLTFILYHYLTVIRGISVDMIGLDLKEGVIANCNRAAQKYGYDHLTFQLGDINGFKCPFDVDMVISLHACDTATDYALYNAVQWGAPLIFSVPCCQHELNGQIYSEEQALLTRYGIVAERFSALLTDAIRGNLLEYMGYNAQLLEFVDLAHTPKNILIRAVKNPNKPRAAKERARAEIERVLRAYHVEPTLYKLLGLRSL